MARKRYSDEDALKLWRENDAHLQGGLDVLIACRKAGNSDKTYCDWRKTFGGMGRPQSSKMRALQKENERLKKNEPLVRHWSEDNGRMPICSSTRWS